MADPSRLVLIGPMPLYLSSPKIIAFYKIVVVVVRVKTVNDKYSNALKSILSHP